jgi:Beta/Gamma crystallin
MGWEVKMRLGATVFSAPFLTAGAIAAGAMAAVSALSPLTQASAAVIQQPARAAVVARPAPRPAAVPRQNFQRPNVNVQRTVVQHNTFVQHNVGQPNVVQRPAVNNVRPVNPNPGFHPVPGFVPNRGNAQQFNNPQFNNPQFNNQQRVIQPGPGGMPHNAVVGGPVNGLRLGPGRPNLPPNMHLGPGPGGFPPGRPNFPVVTVNNRFFPIARGQRFVWVGGFRRTFIPLGVLGVALIGGSYWYPDGYVSVAQPYCAGLTPDGCQLNWRVVDFEDGGGAPQCVQYCPQVGPPPARVAELPPPPPPAPANGSCEMTIYADPNFAGTAAPTAENQPALGQAGWLNEISSVQVQSGTWEFYADENFGGASMRLDPGPYPNLPPEWTKRIGSFQCVQPTA